MTRFLAIGLAGGAALLPIAALSAGPLAARPAARSLPPDIPRITAELKDVTLREMAAELERRQSVFTRFASAASEGVKPGWDTARRASFHWHETPLAEALREICRAYRCRIEAHPAGTYDFSPGALPSGPRCELPGYTVYVNRVTFGDSRTTVGGPETRRTSGLGLELAIRAKSGDAAPVIRLDRLHVVDQRGQELRLETGVNTEVSRVEAHAGTFPDERVQSFGIPWREPQPLRLALIEGDVVVSVAVERETLEFPLPSSGTAWHGNVVGLGALYSPLIWNGGTFRVEIQPTDRSEVEVPADGWWSGVRFRSGDGRLVPACGRREENLGRWRAEFEAARLRERPTAMQWTVLRRSVETRAYHFRFRNYPVELVPLSTPAGGSS